MSKDWDLGKDLIRAGTFLTFLLFNLQMHFNGIYPSFLTNIS